MMIYNMNYLKVIPVLLARTVEYTERLQRGKIHPMSVLIMTLNSI